MVLFEAGNNNKIALLGVLLQSNVLQKRIIAVVLGICFVGLLYVDSVGKNEIFGAASGRNNKSLHKFLRNVTAPDQVLILQQPLSHHATLVLELQRVTSAPADGEVVVSTGLQTAHVFFNDENCPDPHFGVRLKGTKVALVPILLAQSSSKAKQWTGSFLLPIEGTYQVDAQWDGCGSEEDGSVKTTKAEKLSIVVKNKPVEFNVVGSTFFPPTSFVRSLEHNPPSIGEGATFSDGVWVSTQGMSYEYGNQKVDIAQYTDYLWVDPTRRKITDPDDLMILEEEDTHIHTIISKSGTLSAEHKTYIFNHVGNYELVCFFGSQSARFLYDRFMKQLKSQMVVNGVRPFKFHFYNVRNLIHPDDGWYKGGKQDLRKTCRKCKHIILSVDELDNGPLSQAEFQQQYSTFVKHLQKLMDDPTFPIWLLTNNEPISVSTNCHAPYVLPRTTDHPCNDVIRGLMRHGVFESRVNLMDNADLTLPLFDDLESKHRDQIFANIALRIFVLVGKGVQDWRDRGQQAWADGLHRNGKVEPNFELIPYDWNQTV